MFSQGSKFPQPDSKRFEGGRRGKGSKSVRKYRRPDPWGSSWGRYVSFPEKYRLQRPRAPPHQGRALPPRLSVRAFDPPLQEVVFHRGRSAPVGLETGDGPSRREFGPRCTASPSTMPDNTQKKPINMSTNRPSHAAGIGFRVGLWDREEVFIDPLHIPPLKTGRRRETSLDRSRFRPADRLRRNQSCSFLGEIEAPPHISPGA